jgi:hypothetical protein
MSKVLKNTFSEEKYNVSPELTQKNRKKPDMVMQTISENGVEDFIYFEIKIDLNLSPEKVLDQVHKAVFYSKHLIKTVDGRSGIYTVALMGTRIMFFEVY